MPGVAVVLGVRVALQLAHRGVEYRIQNFIFGIHLVRGLREEAVRFTQTKLVLDFDVLLCRPLGLLGGDRQVEALGVQRVFLGVELVHADLAFVALRTKLTDALVDTGQLGRQIVRHIDREFWAKLSVDRNRRVVILAIDRFAAFGLFLNGIGNRLVFGHDGRLGRERVRRRRRRSDDLPARLRRRRARRRATRRHRDVAQLDDEREHRPLRAADRTDRENQSTLDQLDTRVQTCIKNLIPHLGEIKPVGHHAHDGNPPTRLKIRIGL